MTTEDKEQSPFSRPGFIVSALVVALILVFGVVLGIRAATGDEPEQPQGTEQPGNTVGPSAAPSPTPSVEADKSFCGLDGEVLSGTVSTAPDAQWAFEDIIAYPTSSKYGPAETSTAGVRNCFQHSPEGSVFAAANALVQGSGVNSSAWINYFLSAEAPNRAQLLKDVDSGGASPESRLSIEGFRLLSYDGNAARVDIAARASGSGRTVYGSVIYELVWEAGDWKLLPQSATNPLRTAQIPDLAGYISWQG